MRDNLNDVAETWTDEQKGHCLQETTESFKVGWRLLPPLRTGCKIYAFYARLTRYDAG